MFNSPEQFATQPIPFSLSTPERQLLSDLAELVISRGMVADGAYGLTEGMIESAQVIVDPLADESVPICLCSGTGQLLANLLSVGFRLTPAAQRDETAKRANDLVARIVIALSQSPESPSSHDQTQMDNVYRAELGLPVRSSSLLYDQIMIMQREAHTFAKLMGLELKIHIGKEDLTYEPKGDLHHQQIESSEKDGLAPTLIFADRATGGRPAQVGQIQLVDGGTFFASFNTHFLIDGQRVSREQLKDATALRATLIELGRARLQNTAQQD